MAWDDLKRMVDCKAEFNIKKEQIHNLRDICAENAYNFCKYLALASVLDGNPSYRDTSLYFLKLQFSVGKVCGGYEEGGSVYLKVRGLDRLLRTFFVGDVSDYPLPSDNPVPFNLNAD
ncbi:MAG: hypothetical protein V1914_04960 [archaeon]